MYVRLPRVSEEPKVAVVIPTWNSAALLPRLLHSLTAQAVPLEVLVVDNGSSDGTIQMLRERGVPHMALDRNTGFAAAVNLGAARTSARFVLPLNADTELGPGAVAAMVTALAATPGLGGVAPQILQLEGERGDVDTARLYSVGQALTADGRAVELGAAEARGPWSSRAGEVFGVCGAACLLRRELFSELGGYDESFFAFYEDVDLNVRARIVGWRFVYVPEAVVWHLGNASWLAEATRPDAWNSRLVARNRIVTQARFMPLTALPRILGVEVGALARAARHRRFLATLRGKGEGLSRLPSALRERRRLAARGDLSRARVWLGVGRR
jgi:GT2 family glycosyltransferase